ARWLRPRTRGGAPHRAPVRRRRMDRGSVAEGNARGDRAARGLRAATNAGDVGRRMSRILLIEDNRDYAATLASNLEREGYDVAIASTGTAGLAEVKHYQPDLIVLDLMLPAMNGYSVLQRL